MSDFEELVNLMDSESVAYGVALPKDLHKTLCLGQTRYMCRYGTLSDGHEKITPSQRYYQAIREIYYLALSVQDFRARAMEYRAEELEANDQLTEAKSEASKLRAEARLLRAQTGLRGSLVQVKDNLRMLDEYNAVRRELEPEVTAMYPQGIEQAEEDNWKAVFEYRVHKEKLPGAARQPVDSIPLRPEIKAQLGYEHGRIDAIAPLALTQPKACQQIESVMNKERA